MSSIFWRFVEIVKIACQLISDTSFLRCCSMNTSKEVQEGNMQGPYKNGFNDDKNDIQR